MNEIKLPYPSGFTLTATVYSPDGLTALVSDIALTRNNDLYIGDFPTSITDPGLYPVIIKNQNGMIAGDQVIDWKGTYASLPTTINVVSLSDVASADSYFNARLYCNLWFQLSTDQKQAALNDATRAINRLQYIGSKTSDTQPNEWPRKNIRIGGVILDSLSVPQDILFAQFEIAYALASGVNVEKELRSLGITSRGYSSVRITYDPNRTAEWLLAGIASSTAWAYLLPYLFRDSDGRIKLHRVS